MFYFKSVMSEKKLSRSRLTTELLFVKCYFLLAVYVIVFRDFYIAFHLNSG